MGGGVGICGCTRDNKYREKRHNNSRSHICMLRTLYPHFHGTDIRSSMPDDKLHGERRSLPRSHACLGYEQNL
jgi:hypothetical protein